MSTTALRIIKPVEITDSVLYATDVPEDDYAEWSAASIYALGDRVIVAASHRIYESLQSSNIGNTPASSPLMWIEVSSTNRWRLFDTSNSTVTAKPYSMSYTLKPTKLVSSVALLNLTGMTSVRVQVTNVTYGTLYDTTFSTPPLPQSASWWEWFFGDRDVQTQVVIESLPLLLGSTLIIDLTGTADLSIGVLLMGTSVSFGNGVKYGAKVGIQDYSRKETNDFGDTVLVRRAFAKRASFDMDLPNQQIDRVQRLLTDLRATPCLWIGVGTYEATVIYGIYKQFDIVISYFDYSDCQLELEGLT